MHLRQCTITIKLTRSVETTLKYKKRYFSILRAKIKSCLTFTKLIKSPEKRERSFYERFTLLGGTGRASEEDIKTRRTQRHQLYTGNYSYTNGNAIKMPSKCRTLNEKPTRSLRNKLKEFYTIYFKFYCT